MVAHSSRGFERLYESQSVLQINPALMIFAPQRPPRPLRPEK
jgi:hypothetical protein